MDICADWQAGNRTAKRARMGRGRERANGGTVALRCKGAAS
jgi:hypothetical protein